MIPIQFTALATELVHAYQNGMVDANGQKPEQYISNGSGTPCRHCLQPIGLGEPYLVLAHRPFPAPQPYAEVGPIFLHAETCTPYVRETAVVPPILDSEQYIVRGYNEHDKIIYGTGAVVPTTEIPQAAAQLLADSTVAYLHVRSSTNNCFQCRIDRRIDEGIN